MIDIRRSSERGGGDFGWLKTRHTFSFDTYYDPKFVHFGSLRVMNEDWIAGGAGFPAHPHRDMEIITYVLDGALEHKDSLGNGSVIRPGDGQRMSAGSGIQHSEANHSKTELAHLYQIWILPAEKGIAPGYEQKSFSPGEKRGRLCVVAAPDGREGAVTIRQDALLYVSVLAKDAQVEHQLAPGRHAWMQVARGSVELNGQLLNEGDGAAVSEEQVLTIRGKTADGKKDSEILLFDLA